MDRYLILRRNGAAKSPAGRLTRGVQPMGPVRDSTPQITTERATARVAASLAREPEVEAVTPVMPTRLVPPLDAGSGANGSDWGLVATGAAGSRYTGAGVRVAILDTGIAADHPAFDGVTIEQEDFSGVGNGDVQGHGTHCAGTLFGRDFGQRIGVARGVTEALAGKVLRDDGSGDSEMIFDGMQWALRMGADVISMSLGFDFPGMVQQQVDDGWPADLATSAALEAYRGNLRMFDAVMQLARARAGMGRGALVVAAAGNESRRDDRPDWRIAACLPAAAEDVISVAAVGRVGAGLAIAPFSNSMAVVSGPGVDITSAWPGGGLHTISGTSMACPHVAGLAALWWEKVREGGVRPTPANVRTALLGSVRRDALGGAPDEMDFGQGLVTAP